MSKHFHILFVLGFSLIVASCNMSSEEVDGFKEYKFGIKPLDLMKIPGCEKNSNNLKTITDRLNKDLAHEKAGFENQSGGYEGYKNYPLSSSTQLSGPAWDNERRQKEIQKEDERIRTLYKSSIERHSKNIESLTAELKLEGNSVLALNSALSREEHLKRFGHTENEDDGTLHLLAGLRSDAHYDSIRFVCESTFLGTPVSVWLTFDINNAGADSMYFQVFGKDLAGMVSILNSLEEKYTLEKGPSFEEGILSSSGRWIFADGQILVGARPDETLSYGAFVETGKTHLSISYFDKNLAARNKNAAVKAKSDL